VVSIFVLANAKRKPPLTPPLGVDRFRYAAIDGGEKSGPAQRSLLPAPAPGGNGQASMLESLLGVKLLEQKQQ
jgi:hypothetical protein